MRVLVMFICLEDQFVDTGKDLLFSCGPCHVTGFRHGGIGIIRLDKIRLGKRW